MTASNIFGIAHSWPGPTAPRPTRNGSSLTMRRCSRDERRAPGSGTFAVPCRRARVLAARAEEVPVERRVVFAVGALAVLVDEHLREPELRVAGGRAHEQPLEVAREDADEREVVLAEDAVVLARERARRAAVQEQVIHARDAPRSRRAARAGTPRCRHRGALRPTVCDPRSCERRPRRRPPTCAAESAASRACPPVAARDGRSLLPRARRPSDTRCPAT